MPIKADLYAYPRLSPDGTRVAMDGISGGNRDIWMADLQRLSLTRLTDRFGEDMLAEWSRDGTRVFFASQREGNFDIYSQAVDGSGQPTVELSAPGFQSALSVTPDGRQVVIYDQFKDIRLLNLDTHQTTPLLHGDADERLARLSPDGKWMVVRVQRVGTAVRDLCTAVPRCGRTARADLGGRRPVSPLVARRQRGVLRRPRGHDDRCALYGNAAAPNRSASKAIHARKAA